MANLGHTDTMLQYFNTVVMPVNIWQILPYPLYTVYSEYRYSNDFQPSAILQVLTQNSLEKNVLPITPFSLVITYLFNSIAVSFNQFGLNTGVPRLSTHS